MPIDIKSEILELYFKSPLGGFRGPEIRLSSLRHGRGPSCRQEGLGGLIPFSSLFVVQFFFHNLYLGKCGVHIPPVYE